MSDSHAPITPSPAPDAHAGHEAAHDEHDFWGHAKPYLWVGGVLLVFTLITVALSYVDFDHKIGHGWNMIIGMAVATFKVCLVGAIFMHLKGEKKTIWTPLYFTAFFVLGLFLLTLLHWLDPISTTRHFTH